MSVKLLMNNIVASPEMWIGWIPQDLDDTGIGITRVEEMAEEFDETVINFGIVNNSLMKIETCEGSHVIYIPEGAFFAAVIQEGYSVTFDDGFGNKKTLNENVGDFVQNAMPLTNLINNVQYYLFGIMFHTGGTFTFYIDIV